MKSVAMKQTQRKAPPLQANLPKPIEEQPRGGASEAAAQTGLAHEQLVREAAYFIYERSGRIDGREFENWLQAEAELMQPLEAAATKGQTPTA
jgi:hypothetical protein